MTISMKLTPHRKRIAFYWALFFVLGATVLLPSTAGAATAAEINRSARAGLKKLYASTPAARAVGARATAVVIVDTGIAKSLTTTTLRKDIYAFFFSQRGLMAGLGLQGSKITRIAPPCS